MRDGSGGLPGSGPESSLDPSRHQWALDIGATKVVLGRSVGDRVEATARMRTPADPAVLIEWARRLLPGAVPSLGVAFPGGLDAGVVSGWPSRPEWEGFPLVRALAPVSAAVEVSDDGRAAAVGEARLGAGRGQPDLLVVVLGTGLGGAVVLDYVVRAGVPGDPRTLGHLRILPGGRCPCGGLGCAQEALRTLPDDASLGAGLQGWPDGQWLAGFLADLARLLGIRLIVLTGGLLYRPVLSERLARLFSPHGIGVLLPPDPGLSSLLGASVRLERAPGT